MHTVPVNGTRSLAAVADGRACKLWVPPTADEGWRRQSLSKGAAGVAILHGTRAQAGQGSLDLANAWLRQATGGGVTAGSRAGLWFGAPAVAFAIAAAAPGHYPEASRALRGDLGRALVEAIPAPLIG